MIIEVNTILYAIDDVLKDLKRISMLIITKLIKKYNKYRLCKRSIPEKPCSDRKLIYRFSKIVKMKIIKFYQ